MIEQELESIVTSLLFPTVGEAARIIYQDTSASGPSASFAIPLDLLVADVEDHFRGFCHIEKYLHAPLRLEDQFLVQINNGKDIHQCDSGKDIRVSITKVLLCLCFHEIPIFPSR